MVRINKILEFLLYFFCFFPFIAFVNIGTDMQPYAFLIATVYIIFNTSLKSKWFDYTQIFFLCYVAILLVLSMTSNEYFTIIRSFFNYISVSIISLAVYISLKQNNGINEYYIKAFIIIWLLIGMIQLFVDRSFLGTIISNFRTSSTRGVCSLASEPSFYGYISFFFLIISYQFKNNRIIYILLSIFQIVVLAQSTVTISYVIIYYSITLLYKFVKNKNIKSILLIISAMGILAISFAIINKYLPNTRMVILINKMASNPLSILNDERVEQRFNHIKLAIESFCDSYGFPHGYAVFITYSKRIMSGYGAVLHELGIIGAFYIVLWFVYISKAYDYSAAVAITIIMFSAIQVGNPIFCFFLGICIYLYKESKISSSSIKEI